jgi:hypothetical protein
VAKNVRGVSELTATGIVPDLHGIPFSSVLPNDKTEPNAQQKYNLFFEMGWMKITFWKLLFGLFNGKFSICVN